MAPSGLKRPSQRDSSVVWSRATFMWWEVDRNISRRRTHLFWFRAFPRLIHSFWLTMSQLKRAKGKAEKGKWAKRGGNQKARERRTEKKRRRMRQEDGDENRRIEGNTRKASTFAWPHTPHACASNQRDGGKRPIHHTARREKGFGMRETMEITLATRHNGKKSLMIKETITQQGRNAEMEKQKSWERKEKQEEENGEVSLSLSARRGTNEGCNTE